MVLFPFFRWIATFFFVLCLAPPVSVGAQPPSPGELKARAWADPLTPLRLLPPAVDRGQAASASERPAPAEAAPAGLGDWTRVAFQSYRDGNWEIYLAGGDGSGAQRLTDNPAADVLPSLDRAASLLAFASKRSGNLDIYTVRADGSDLRLAVGTGDAETDPALSPDGSRLAYARDKNNNLEIYLANADGSGARRMTNDSAIDFWPAWSFDGARLAWVRSNGKTGAVTVANADGSNARSVSPQLRYLENVAWSPDGRFLAFDYDADGDGWNELGVIGSDGSGLRMVYDPGGALLDAWMGSWTGDGNWLAFSLVQYVVQNNQLYLGATWILRAPLAGGSLAEVSATGVDHSPAWRSLDVTPPTSALKPLPTLTRVESSNNGPVTVHISGSDGAGAGIAGFDVQVRTNYATEWQDLVRDVLPDAQCHATATVQHAFAGTSYAFRVRARDLALNVEPWRSAPDTETLVYGMRVSGEMRDARGVLLPNAQVIYETDQALSGPFSSRYRRGRFELLFNDQNYRELEARQPGYTSSPRAYFSTSSDHAGHAFYLPGAPSLISNGDFETGVIGWHLGGVYTPTRAYPARNGQKSLQIGRLPGLSDVIQLNPYRASWGDPVSLVMDTARTEHILYRVSDSYTAAIYYRYRPAGGQWSEPETLVQEWGIYALAVAPDDTLHALISGYADEAWRLYHREKPAGGAWSPPILLPDVPADGVTQMQLLAGEHGRLDLIYSCRDCPSSLYHVARGEDGSWGAALAMTQESLGWSRQFQAARMSSGETQLFWRETQATLSADGTWSAQRDFWSMPPVAGMRGPSLTADPAGRLVLMWIAGEYSGPCQRITLSSTDGGVTWSGPWIGVVMSCELPALIDDGLGVVHAFGVGPTSVNSVGFNEYYSRSDDGGRTWSTPAWLAADFPVDAGLADPVDRRLVLVTGGSLGEMALDLPPGDSVLSRTLAIPADLPAPTLSFFYRAGQIGPGTAEPLSVTVNGAPIWTGAPETPDWRHTWLDLSAFRGQTVTLAFRTTGAADSSMGWAQLDEISLSAWQTPVASKVVLDGRTLRLEGSNFAAGTTVQLNDGAPMPASVIDAGHLQVTLPTALGPGLYDITTIAPDNRAGVALAPLRIGQPSYLPLLAR